MTYPFADFTSRQISRARVAYSKALQIYQQYGSPVFRKCHEIYCDMREQKRLHAERTAAREAAKRAAEVEAEAAARRAAFDPEGAVEDMRLARSYLDDWYDKKGPQRDALSFAAKYIEQARRKDANAILVTERDGQEMTYTQDELSGVALFYEAQMHRTKQAPPEALKRAAEALRKAIAYAPYSIQYRALLADVYLDLYDKPSALAIAQEAVQTSPKNLDARKLLDRIEAAPSPSPPGVMETNPWMLAAFGALLVTAGVVFLVMSIFKDTGGIAMLFFIVGGILWFVGSRAENSQMMQKAINNQIRKRES